MGQQIGDFLAALLAGAWPVDAAQGRIARALVALGEALDDARHALGAVLLVLQQRAFRLMIGEFERIDGVAAEADLHRRECSTARQVLTTPPDRAITSA